MKKQTRLLSRPEDSPLHPLLAPLVVASSLLPAAQEAAPTGRQLVERFAASLENGSAIAFDAKVTMRVDKLEIAQKAKVILARPDRARLELAGAGQDQVLVLDGTSAWHYFKANRGYLQAKQRGIAKLEQYGVGPVATLFFQKGMGSLAPYLADAAVTKEDLDGECRVVSWHVGAEASSLWLSATGDRLRRFRTTRSSAGQSFEQTIDYGAFDLAPHVADDTFTFVPPQRSHPLDPDSEDDLLAVGAEAPDFTVTRLDGSTVKRTDARDGPLLLTFWFYGCATCREEFPRLERLRQEFGPRGVAMVAVNFGDARETVAAYFEKERFTFTPALQTKDEVSRAFGVQSYPTTYLLDRAGRIVWRSVGFDEESLRAALESAAPHKGG